MRRIGAVLCALVCLLATDAAAHHEGFRGSALYYSNEYAGDPMACGPLYQPWKMVAAHRKIDIWPSAEERRVGNG